MFIPVAAILQGIVVLFIALGQWATGTYYALAPNDGGDNGRIEIVRGEGANGPMRIEARLPDGRQYAASFSMGARRAIVKSAPMRHASPALSAYARASVAVELYAQDGTSITCRFAETRQNRPGDGSCLTPEGRHFEIVAIASPAPPDATPPHRPLG
jgi:hypothetical protein